MQGVGEGDLLLSGTFDVTLKLECCLIASVEDCGLTAKNENSGRVGSGSRNRDETHIQLKVKF